MATTLLGFREVGFCTVGSIVVDNKTELVNMRVRLTQNTSFCYCCSLFLPLFSCLTARLLDPAKPRANTRRSEMKITAQQSDFVNPDDGQLLSNHLFMHCWRSIFEKDLRKTFCRNHLTDVPSGDATMKKSRDQLSPSPSSAGEEDKEENNIQHVRIFYQTYETRPPKYETPPWSKRSHFKISFVSFQTTLEHTMDFPLALKALIGRTGTAIVSVNYYIVKREKTRRRTTEAVPVKKKNTPTS
ncbi:hypothetical protein CBL_11325 [Carabus blaptoides fortunei]